jgi:hypothetical protein
MASLVTGVFNRSRRRTGACCSVASEAAAGTGCGAAVAPRPASMAAPALKRPARRNSRRLVVDMAGFYPRRFRLRTEDR